MIIRIWGRTVLNQRHNDLIAIVEDMKTAFSTRPCFGIDIRGSTNLKKVRNGLEVREEPVRRLVSTACTLWSDDSYSDENIQEREGALCKICKNISSEQPFTEDVKAEMMEERVRDQFCGICGKGFFTKAHLKSHVSQKHAMHPAPSHAYEHECSDCGMGFGTVLELSAHEESGQCEGDDTFRQDVLSKVKCEIEDAESDSAPSHWRDGDDFRLPHMKEEEDNGVDTKSYSQSDPLKAYDDKGRMKHLKKALKSAHVPRPYRKQKPKAKGDRWPMPCEVCAEWMPDKMSLGIHMTAAHPGEQPYKCTFCEKAYRSSAQMYIHRDVECDWVQFKDTCMRLKYYLIWLD